MTLHLRDELADAIADLTDADGDPLSRERRRELSASVVDALVDELQQSGRDRTALVNALAGELNRALGLCGDRRDGIARTLLDRLLDRLKREAVG